VREVEALAPLWCSLRFAQLDIDHLKHINDHFGHPAGDHVIRQVAQTLSEVSRDNDTAARLGGEEFALLLACIDVEKAGAGGGTIERGDQQTAL
jgi:diguanylate cyclase (GGDEF)-like protein